MSTKRLLQVRRSLPLLLLWVGCSEKFAPINLADSERMNSTALTTAAVAARGAGRTEDAAFLFLAGQARYQIDKQVYPPRLKGGDEPGALNGALRATVGPPIIQSLEDNPEAYAKVVERLSNWSPKIGKKHNPGWNFQNALDDATADKVVASTLDKLRRPLAIKAKVLGDPEYQRLARQLSEAHKDNRSVSAKLAESRTHPIPEATSRKLTSINRKIAAAATRMKEIEWERATESRWHHQVGWKAEDYFNDSQVVALCEAIELNDLEKMERLIAAGADPNALGKDGMTPLLWAFPDRKIERFECLLRHGANPNVVIASDLGAPDRPFHADPAGNPTPDDGGCHAGQAVIHLACQSRITDYLKLVMAHGGDANLVDGNTGMAPLDIVMSRYLDVQPRVEMLLASGADRNRFCEYKLAYPTTQAVNLNKFGTALTLLKAGAKPELYQPNEIQKLSHFLVRAERNLPHFNPQMSAEYQELATWLEQHGESLEQARQDEADWAMRFAKGNHNKIRDQIIAERMQAAPRNPTARGE
jgi:uncharacterized protein